MQNSRLVDLFMDLVKIDSPTGEEEKVADFLADYLTANKLADVVLKDDAGNVYARKDGIGKPLFFSAHMDTVEPGRGIKPKVEGEYIVSEGETILGGDNKIAIACILETLNQLKESKVSNRPLEVIFTYSEEIESLGAINFDYSQLKAKEGFCFDYAMPVGAIVTASPFYERFDLTLIGKAAHGSRPEEGINALLILRDLLNILPIGRVKDDLLVNIGMVECGSVRNTIPEKVFLKGEIRSLNEKELSGFKDLLLFSIKEVLKKYNASYTIEFVLENPGYQFDSSEGLIKMAERKIKEIGLKPRLLVSWGVSDANIFNTRGLTCVNLADGGEMAHTTKERVKISELENLTRLMVALCEN